MNDTHRNGSDDPCSENSLEAAPVNERAARLGPDWELKPSDLAWVSNYRDWHDVRQSLLRPFRGALNIIKGWFRP